MKRKKAFAYGARRNPGEILVLSNPSKRGKHRHHKAKRRAGFGFRARRNPLAIVSTAVPVLKVAAIGAVGGLANDILAGFLLPKLPKMFSDSNAAKTGLKLVTAVAMGLIPKKGRDLAVGAATCTLHDAARAFLIDKFPSVPMGEYVSGYPGSAYPQISGYPGGTGDFPSVAPPLMGAYVSGDDSGYDN